jgi:hypothetical protein
MFLTLLIGAMTVGSLHALAPDHWVPFAAVARGRSWSAGRTARVTFLCGFSHASVSALLGLVALFVGLEVMQSFGSSMGSVGTPSAVVVVVAYEAATLPTMVALVLLARAAATRLRWHFLEHYADGATRSGFAGAWFNREQRRRRGSLSRATLALRQRVAASPAKLPA